MNLKKVFSFLLIAAMSMSAFAADISSPAPSTSTTEGSTTQHIPPGIKPMAHPPGIYIGPNGQRIQIKQPMSRGGPVTDLAAKGIIIISNKPTDGKYVGPGGASIIVQRGIIVQ